MAIPPPTADQIFITPADLRKRYGNFDPNTFTYWQDKDLVRKLRNGLYLNNAFEIRGKVDQFMIANHLYEPSYVSLHSALHYYGLIPEFVYEVTSVSPKKTKQVNLANRRYHYRTLKPELFFGFENVPWRGGHYSIAYPEKAILDLAYLEPRFSDHAWVEELRFDRGGIMELDWDRLTHFSHIMNSEVVRQRIAVLLDVLADD